MNARGVMLSALAVVFGVLAYVSAPALAAAPEAPGPVTVESVTGTSAGFSGELNTGKTGPAGTFELGTYEFLYSKSPSTCEGGSRAPEPAGLSLGGGMEVVTQPVSGLAPGAEYTVCLRAVNGAAEEAVGPPATFTTPAVAPKVESESVTDVASTSATLQAVINPGGASTTYRFEYGTTASYGTSLPVPDGEVGFGAAGVAVSIHTQTLSPDTGYHFRVVAVNGVETVDGPDQVFTTQSVGTAFVLPDDRQYEMVSPPQKNGTETLGIRGYSGGGIVQSSENGEKITYITGQPPELDPPNNVNAAQLFSVRGVDGWDTQNISLRYAGVSDPSVGGGTEYKGFSPDLSHGVVAPFPNVASALLSPEVPADVRDLFLRDDVGDTYTPVATNANLLPGSPEFVFLHYVGATRDLSHLVFTSRGVLSTGAPSPEVLAGASENLYEWSGGGIKLVSILPNGEASTGGASFDAISSDGNQVVWSVDGQLYATDPATGETVQLNLSQGGPDASGESGYQASSGDGSLIFFNSPVDLTAEARTCRCGFSSGRPETGDLYEYDLNTRTLVDLTIDHNAADIDGAEVMGVLGASEDASYVYFVARGVLATGAVSGEPNLYVAHYDGVAWSTKLIVTLASKGGQFSLGDDEDWSLTTDGEAPKHEARVSPNGRFVAFESLADLTSYDNRDANTGQPDVEVYVYDAATGGLTCASCSPTGARPVASAGVPGFTPFEVNGAVYQSRYLSDQGRLFFDTGEALVPQDVNGKQDVYEYEPEGIGSCVLGSGCVDLISSGIGLADSAFVDASASGDDVFFNTSAQLLPQDFDHAFDIYDAHVCTGGAPCFPAPAVSVPECTNVDQCKPPPTPQPALFGAPAGATFVGAGNPDLTVSKPPAAPVGHGKTKHKTKRKKKGRRKANGRKVGRGSGARKSRARGSLSGRAGRLGRGER